MRRLIGLIGLLTALVPDRIIGVFEDVAIENPSECQANPWLRSGIRIEGIVITLASLLGGRAYAWMMNLTGFFGAIVLLFPQLYREFASALVYENSDAVEWNAQFTTGVRLIGALYVIMAIISFRKRHNED